MQEVTFTLQTITPMFLAGADQTKAELRAPSFRGPMRYWQRALVGGLVGTGQDGLKQVMQAETDVFGATDTGSAVSIKVSGVSGEPREFNEQISVRVAGKWQATGKGYLLWSMARSGREDKGNLKPARWHYPPGTNFQVTLSSRSQDGTKLSKAVASLWLLTQLGGIGSRSRRCAGSLTVQSIENNTSDLPFTASADALALKQQIELGLITARSLYSHNRQTFREEALFDVLAPQACRIWILQDEQPWRNPEIAMQELGEKLQEYRSHISSGPRKIFGLPLPPIIFNKRRASPLLLRVTKLQREQYVGIAVLFKTVGSDVNIKDYKLIEDWTNEFRGKQEVRL
jgi:CRISPR-associated protein Cmr1